MRLPLALCLGSLAVVIASTVQADDPAAEWAGAWLVRDASYPGSVEAWNVTGPTVTVYDAARRRTETQSFVIVSPCRISRTYTFANGTQEVVYDTFALANDGLHVAALPADGGLRRGSRTTVCVGEHVYVYDAIDRSCREWDVNMKGSWQNAECSFTDPPTTFVIRPPGMGETMRVDVYGDALLSGPLFAHRAERCASFDEAVRRANAR